MACAAALAGACACSSPTPANPGDAGQTLADAGDAGSPSGDAAAPVLPDAGCSAGGTSSFPEGAVPAGGTVTGDGVSAVACNGGTYAQIESAGARADTVPYFFSLTYASGSSTTLTDFAFESPAGAMHGEVDVFVGLPAAAPGTYTSPAGQDCGFGNFTYYLPPPAGVDCSAGTDVSCPQGCGRVCPASGCAGIPCVAMAPSVSYLIQGSTNCMAGTQTVMGSWTLTLTSVTPVTPTTPDRLSYFSPHGTLEATAVSKTNGGQVTLSFVF
jgi:hypothetical protein